MKKFWKMIVPDFKIRTNLENLNKWKKNRAREERRRVEKVKLEK